MYEFLRNLFASEQPVMERFNVVDPTAVGSNVRSITLAYTPSTDQSATSVVSLFWTDSKNKVYEKQFKDETQAQSLYGSMQSDLTEAADLTRTEKMESAASLVRSLLKRYSIYTDELVDGNPAPVTNTNADLKLSKIQNPLVNKTAKVVMQNLFFETPEELQKYQEMNKKNQPGGKQLGDFKDDLPPMDKNKMPGEGMGEEAPEDGLAPSSLSYEDYEKGKAQEAKSLTKRIEREVKDQVKSALERKVASTFDETDDELIDAMRSKGRTWEEIKNYFTKELQYDKDSVAAYIDALREAEHGGVPGQTPGQPPAQQPAAPTAPKPPTDLVSPETHDKLVKEIDDKNPVQDQHEIDKQDMAMGEIATQSVEITKVADEPLETIPKGRPDTNKKFDWEPDENNMADDVDEDPAAAPDPGDVMQVQEENLVPGHDTKVYVMKDYQSGDGGYEGTLVGKFSSGGEEFGFVDGPDGVKDIPIRDIKRASIFRRLVKFAAERKRQREEQRAKTAQAELRAIMAEIKVVDVELKKEADSSVVMPMLYAITDKDILAYANGSMYRAKIEANEMTDEDWKLLVKETGRWMPHTDRHKTSMFYPQDAEWNFDPEQISKIKSMFTNLPATSSLKDAANQSHHHVCRKCDVKFGKECGCGHPKVNTDLCPKCEDPKKASLKEAAPSDLIYHLLHTTDTKGNHRLQTTWCGKDSMTPYTEMVPESIWEQVPQAQKCVECEQSYKNGAAKTASPENPYGFDPKDENMACKQCGRKDLPLHTDYKCPNCSKYGKPEHKEAAPGDVVPQQPAVLPAKEPPVNPEPTPTTFKDVKISPKDTKKKEIELVSPELAKLIQEYDDVQHSLTEITNAVAGIKATMMEKIKEVERGGKKTENLEQAQRLIESIAAGVAKSRDKVVRNDEHLWSLIEGIKTKEYEVDPKDMIQKIIEKFDLKNKGVYEFMKKVEDGAHALDQEIKTRELKRSPVPSVSSLSRVDKVAGIMDTLNYLYQSVEELLKSLPGEEQPAAA